MGNCRPTEKGSGSILVLNHNFFHHIALANGVDQIQAFINFTEDGVVSVKMCSGAARMADEELGPACIAAGVCHR